MGWFVFADRMAPWCGELDEISKGLTREQDGQAVGPGIRGRLVAPTHFGRRIKNQHRLLRGIEGNLQQSQRLTELIQEGPRIGVLRSGMWGQGRNAGLLGLRVGAFEGPQCSGETPDRIFGFFSNNKVFTGDHGAVVADRGQGEGVVHHLRGFGELKAGEAAVVELSELRRQDFANGFSDQARVPAVHLTEARIELHHQALRIGAHEGKVEFRSQLSDGSRGPCSSHGF